MKFSLPYFVNALACAVTVEAFITHQVGQPPDEENELSLRGRADPAPTYNSSTFQQILDHKTPDAGTFSQFFWWSDEWWQGPGSPVIFFTPGEIDAARYTTYLTAQRMTGPLAQKLGAAIIVMEHRYWGKSSPYEVLTDENLKYLTLENSIADTQYFARNAYLPFDPTNSSNADNVPWVFVGGSYSGALAAWTEATTRDNPAFWATLATSAVVETIWDYWQYFVPTMEGMPKNCSKDVNLVINYMDDVFTHGSQSEQLELKKMFGLESLDYNPDVMSVLNQGPQNWQGNQFDTYYSAFYQWCDGVEGVTQNQTLTSAQASANGVGLQKALAGYANWTKEVLLPGFCADTFGYTNDTTDLSCFKSKDKTNEIFTDLSIENSGDRQWNWMLCNEPFGWWQDGAPRGHQTIVSRLVSADYFSDQCSLYFPNTTFSKDVEKVNKYTSGWDITNTTRLWWTNGQFDPWRTSTVSSGYRPGGPLKSTSEAPLAVIPHGIHCSDLRTANGAVNAGVQAVIDAEIAQLVAWVAEWPEKKQ